MDLNGEMTPKEESIQAFMDLLVEPILQKYGRIETPSPAAHQEVAKQMRAVVFLYNYYHRKQFPELEFLDALTFCKMAVIRSKKLLAYMGILKGTNVSASDSVLQATITEKMVREACETCKALNSPRTMSNAKTFPVSNVAVFVVDATYERCILTFGSITKGVWSFLEKDVGRFDNLEEPQECARQNKITGSSKRPVGCIANAGDTSNRTTINGMATDDQKTLKKLAFSAIKEQTGIDECDLEMLSEHLVYSLTRAKTNSQLYMMRCIKEAPLSSFPYTEVKWVPIKLALTSVEGPLLENVSCSYQASSVVSYFHLWPYSEAIHGCFQWKFSSNNDRTSETFDGMKDQASDHQNSQAHSNRSNRNNQEHLAPKLPCISDELRKTKADFIEDPSENDIAFTRKSEQAAAAPNPANNTLKYGPMITKDGEDAGKASGQFLDKDPIRLQHKFSATNQANLGREPRTTTTSSTQQPSGLQQPNQAMDDQIHNIEDFSTQTPMKTQVFKVDQTHQPKEKSEERHQDSLTQKQAVIQTISEVNITETIVNPEPEKDHFASFQCSAQTQEIEMNACTDETTPGSLDFFLQHLRKKQKLKSTDVTACASRENSQISEMGPALTSSIVLDPTKMQHTTALMVASSFQKQIEQRVAKYKLENEQLHQKIDSIYKFVHETFTEAINVSEGDLPDNTIDKLQVALKSLADSKNKDPVPLKINRDLVSKYLLIADELEKEVNKSYRKLSVATQDSFTIFVELHNWPTLLIKRDVESSKLLCEVQQATSQCLTLTTLNDRIFKLQEAQEKAKKIQQWYESCPSIIMQLQSCQNSAEYQWKALQKVVIWAVDETLDILKEKPECVDSAAIHCTRLQNLDDRLVQAIDEWEKFKLELLNAVPELNNLFQKSS